jgi:alcohol-forming fatty acyl-CoA reductase
VFDKLIVVSGDVSEDGLGLKDQALVEEILKKVTVVFHCAACVRFDMTMKYALTFNTKGTKRVLDFCNQIENLEVRINNWTTQNINIFQYSL